MINSQLGGTQKLTEEGTQKRTGGDTKTHRGVKINAQGGTQKRTGGTQKCTGGGTEKLFDSCR